MNPVKGAGKNPQVGEMLLGGGDDFGNFLALIDGHDKDFRRVAPSGFKQINARGVAIEEFEAELAQRIDLLGIVVEHHGLEALGLAACGRRSCRSGHGRQ